MSVYSEALERMRTKERPSEIKRYDINYTEGAHDAIDKLIFADAMKEMHMGVGMEELSHEVENLRDFRDFTKSWDRFYGKAGDYESPEGRYAPSMDEKALPSQVWEDMLESGEINLPGAEPSGDIGAWGSPLWNKLGFGSGYYRAPEDNTDYEAWLAQNRPPKKTSKEIYNAAKTMMESKKFSK